MVQLIQANSTIRQYTTKSSMKYNFDFFTTCIILPSWLTKSISDNNLKTSWDLKAQYKSTKMLKKFNFSKRYSRSLKAAKGSVSNKTFNKAPGYY